MKKLKIFSLPTHCTKERTSGVDFARIIQPMKHLNGFKNNDIEFETYIYDPVKDINLDWVKVTAEYDLVYFNYTVNPWAFAFMGSVCRKFGIPMVIDLDDNLWNVQSDNVVYETFKKGSEGVKNLTAIINEVDFVTCTNSYLRNVIVNNTRKSHDLVKIFDNYVDLDVYKYPQEFKDSGDIVLTHFGSSTHFVDIQNREFIAGVDRVMKEFPNVSFLTVGSFIPSLRHKWGQRYQNEFGDVDLYKWIDNRFPEVMAKTDICVVPLDNNVYTRCKSAIKWLEMSSAKKPGVWQRIRQYENVIDGNNGLLASSADEWYQAIKLLIMDKEKRRQMGETAYEDTKKHQIKDQMVEYANFFEMIDKTFGKS